MLIATDPLSLFFLACFLFGLLFFLGASLLGGHGHGHVGQGHTGAHVGMHGSGHGLLTHAAATHVAGHGVHLPIPAQNAAHGGAQHAQGNAFSLLSFVNPTSVVLFLLGFGFFGYVFHSNTSFALPLDLLLAVIGGLVISALLLLLIQRVFGDSEGATIQDVSDRTGLLGKVSITIPDNGLGEIIYVSPGGMRKSIAAHSSDGRRLERDQEVVVINYQHGVAEVETWDRFMNTDEDASGVSAPDAAELEKLRALLEETDSAGAELVLRKDVQKE